MRVVYCHGGYQESGLLGLSCHLPNLLSLQLSGNELIGSVHDAMQTIACLQSLTSAPLAGNALNGEIEEKQNELDRLKAKIGAAKKKVGYDASDLDAFLQTRAVNSDFESSKSELETLRAKLEGLVAQHSALTGQSRE